MDVVSSRGFGVLIEQVLHLAKSLKNSGLSVKCILLTDKSSKMGSLSVNLNEILAELVEQRCFKKIVFSYIKIKKPDEVSRK